jgi:hypothetical protein
LKKDVLDIQTDLQFLRLFRELPHGFTSALIADIVRDRFMIITPRDVNGTRHDEHIFHTKVMRTLGDFASQIHPLSPLGRIIAGQWVGPKEE